MIFSECDAAQRGDAVLGVGSRPVDLDGQVRDEDVDRPHRGEGEEAHEEEQPQDGVVGPLPVLLVDGADVRVPHVLRVALPEPDAEDRRQRLRQKLRKAKCARLLTIMALVRWSYLAAKGRSSARWKSQKPKAPNERCYCRYQPPSIVR